MFPNVAKILRKKLPPRELRDIILDFVFTNEKDETIEIVHVAGCEPHMKCSYIADAWLDQSVVGIEAAGEAARTFYHHNAFRVRNSVSLPLLQSSFMNYDLGFATRVSTLQLAVLPYHCPLRGNSIEREVYITDWGLHDLYEQDFHDAPIRKQLSHLLHMKGLKKLQVDIQLWNKYRHQRLWRDCDFRFVTPIAFALQEAGVEVTIGILERLSPLLSVYGNPEPLFLEEHRWIHTKFFGPELRKDLTAPERSASDRWYDLTMEAARFWRARAKSHESSYREHFEVYKTWATRVS